MSGELGDALKVSVLITTYLKEKASNLDEALASMYAQTLKPSEIVLVVDGPVHAEQAQVIRRYKSISDVPLVVVNLNSNVGRGRAKNIGLEQCSNNLVAIMDSDDISMPHRLQVQAQLFARSGVDVVAGWQQEFDDATRAKTYVKRCPESHADIVKALRWTNVVPNPAVMVKRNVALSVGGYGDLKTINEDYDFFLRMVEAGARFYGIQDILIHVRTSPDQRRRRGGWKVMVDDFRFRYRHFKAGFYSLPDLVLMSAVYLLFRLTPSVVKSFVYKVARRA